MDSVLGADKLRPILASQKLFKTSISWDALAKLQTEMDDLGMHCLEVSPPGNITEENPNGIAYVFFMIQDGLPDGCNTQLDILKEMGPDGRLFGQELHGDGMIGKKIMAAGGDLCVVGLQALSQALV